MNIRIVSDLHLDIIKTPREMISSIIKGIGDVDYIIIAGDLAEVRKPIFTEAIEIFSSMVPVIFVAGNHEYYFNSVDYVENFLQDLDARIEDFHFLDNQMLTIDGISFYGGTAWFPYQSSNDFYFDSINDFSLIYTDADSKDSKYKRANFFYNKNREFRDQLQGKKPDVIITHHIPSYNFVNQKYRDSPINRFFVADLDQEITTALEENTTKLWVFGHTHNSFFKTIGNIKFIANPGGYYPEENPPFLNTLTYDLYVTTTTTP